MDVFTVSFFGHRMIDDPLETERKLTRLISELMRKPYVVFLVGRDGEFDQCVSSVIKRCKRELGGNNCAHVWVLPYETALYRNNEEAFAEYYDEIEIREASSRPHYKQAYQARNRDMVDRSDLVIFCVQHPSGGAWQTMQYAIRQGVPFWNLAEVQLKPSDK